MNLYAYVGNDPVNGVDPSGEAVALAACVGPQAVACAAVASVVLLAAACVFYCDDIARAVGDAFQGPQPAPRADVFNPDLGAEIASPDQQPEGGRPSPNPPPVAFKRKQEQQYTVRVQAEGRALSAEASQVISGNQPVKKGQVLNVIDNVVNSLPRRDRRRLQSATRKAKTWVRRTARAGGVGPGSFSFSDRTDNPADARVDIEIIRGQPNIVE